jgi:hypothetical protein
MSFSTYLPSRKFFLSILGIAVACVITLVLVQLIDKNNILVPSDRSALVIDDATVEQFQEFSQLDTDGDGLKDWEESLWDTDSNNPDTDGDGATDLEQVSLARSLVQDTSVSSGTETISPSEQLTNTDMFARDLFTTISVLDQQGVLQDNTDLIKSQIAESVNSIQLYQPFTFSDIKLVETNNTTITTYMGRMNIILARYPYDYDDLILVLNASTQEEPVDTDAIHTIITKYQSLVVELEEIEVPTSFRDVHMGLVNAWRHYVGVVDAFANTQSDPLLSMAGTQQIQGALDGIIYAYQDFSEALFQ